MSPSDSTVQDVARTAIHAGLHASPDEPLTVLARARRLFQHHDTTAKPRAKSTTERIADLEVAVALLQQQLDYVTKCSRVLSNRVDHVEMAQP